jgi:hypothetical protein
MPHPQIDPASASCADLESLRKALSFSMSPTARDWSELALRRLEDGDLQEGLAALRHARTLCDGPTAARHLRIAADRLEAAGKIGFVHQSSASAMAPIRL